MEILLILLLGAFVSNYMARRIDKEAEGGQAPCR